MSQSSQGRGCESGHQRCLLQGLEEVTVHDLKYVYETKQSIHCSCEAPGRNTISPLPQMTISPLPLRDSLQKFSLAALKSPDLKPLVNGLSGPHGCPTGFPEETRELKGWESRKGTN